MIKYIGNFWFEIGWFSGEDFVIFSFNLFECNKYIGTYFVTMLRIKILKFAFGMGWEKR